MAPDHAMQIWIANGHLVIAGGCDKLVLPLDRPDPANKHLLQVITHLLEDYKRKSEVKDAHEEKLRVNYLAQQAKTRALIVKHLENHPPTAIPAARKSPAPPDISLEDLFA